MNTIISNPQVAFSMAQQKIDERVDAAALRRTARSTKRAARAEAHSAEPRRTGWMWAARRAFIRTPCEQVRDSGTHA
jgi:hypothetical protein